MPTKAISFVREASDLSQILLLLSSRSRDNASHGICVLRREASTLPETLLCNGFSCHATVFCANSAVVCVKRPNKNGRFFAFLRNILALIEV